MIKIFSDKQAAQDLCDKIHEYLQDNCPSYNAVKWQDPTPSDKDDEWYVQLPQEYDYELKEDKDLYPVKELIVLVVKTTADKATKTLDALPADWTTPKALTIAEEEIKP